MRPSSLSSSREHREADQRDGRSDGEWPDVLEKQTWQPAETNKELQDAGNDNGALDLEKNGNTDETKKKKETESA